MRGWCLFCRLLWLIVLQRVPMIFAECRSFAEIGDFAPAVHCRVNPAEEKKTIADSKFNCRWVEWVLALCIAFLLGWRLGLENWPAANCWISADYVGDDVTPNGAPGKPLPVIWRLRHLRRWTDVGGLGRWSGDRWGGDWSRWGGEVEMTFEPFLAPFVPLLRHFWPLFFARF